MMAVKGKGGNFRENLVEMARAEGVPVEEVVEKEKPPVLPGAEAKNPMASTVRDKMMLAEYVKPHFSRSDDEDNTRLCSMEFSFPLTVEHKGVLPKKVDDAWKYLTAQHPKGVIGIEIPDQVVDIRLAPDDDVELHINVAEITKAEVRLVRKLGKGTTEKVARFSFRVTVEATKVDKFACRKFGEPVWIELNQVQATLL